MMVKRTCLFCGKKFTRYLSEKKLREGRGKFCSKECFIEHERRGKVKCTCEVCGKVFYGPKSQVDAAKGEYCSVRCKNLSRGKGWREPTPKLARERSRKGLLRETAHARAICGYDEVVEVVHLLPVSRGGETAPSNSISLCPNHHKEYDGGLISRSRVP